MTNEEKPEIFIDEDWKAQVERERELAKKSETDQEPASGETPEEGRKQPSLWDNHVATLCAQAMMALGLVREEGQQQVYVDVEYAKHVIDTLDMLREKTKGNLDKDEERNLNDAIGEMKQVFSVRVSQIREAAMKGGGGPTMPDPDSLKEQ